MTELSTGQTSLEVLRRKLQLAEALASGPQQQSNGPVGAGLRGLAQILAARNANKITGQVAEQEKAQRTGDYALLGEMLDNGKIDMTRLPEFSDDRIAQVALALGTRQADPEDIKTYKRADGVTVYLTGPNQGQPVPGQEGIPTVDPTASVELQRELLGVRRDANEIDREQIALQREEGQRVASKLSATSEKALDLATQDAIAAGQSRFELEALANDYATLDPASGLSAKWQESLKGLTGQEDAVSVLRTRYAKMRNSEAVKNLPPGVASDRDIALALEGFLPATANPQEVSSFLRGLSKMSAFDEAYNSYKASYIDENNGIRGLLSAWKGSDELAQLREGMTNQAGQATTIVNGVEVEIIE